MELTSEQKAQIVQWVEEGAGLGEVQRRIREEFGAHMTYMEVRFLVLDIGASVKDKEEPKPKTPPPAEPQEPQDYPEPPDSQELPGDTDIPDGQDAPGSPADAPDPLGAAKVSVELDKVVRAGAAMSGSVTFSDGVTGSWILDAYGRLALTKVSKPGYQPTRADLEAFQLRLQSLLGGY